MSGQRPEALRAWFAREKNGAQWYAVLDAARSPRVLPLLRASPDRSRSLYDGAKGDELSEVAPYLVALSDDATLWEPYLTEGWGDAWGVAIASEQGFDDLRRHLRRFLRVQSDDGKRMLFRWYDPRVLRAYLPTCTDDERRVFHGPARDFVTDGDDPGELLRFTAATALPARSTFDE